MSAPASDDTWWWIRSAEYVLGLLGNEDQKVFSKVLEHDESARRHVNYWQERFQPLSEYPDPVSPPESVWSAIEQELSIELPLTPTTNESRQSRKLNENQDQSGNTESDKIVKVENEDTETQFQEELVIEKNETAERGADLWRLIAASAVAATLFLGILIKGDLLNRDDTQVLEAFEAIALIKDERGVPIWVVDSVARDKLIRVTTVESPEIAQDRSFQLWLLKPDDGSEVSLGLLSDRSGQSVLIKANGLTPDAVAYAVSIEPRGGSLVDSPSGPVLYQGSIQYLARTP